jgi:hypothetical protein
MRKNDNKAAVKTVSADDDEFSPDMDDAEAAPLRK